MQITLQVKGAASKQSGLVKKELTVKMSAPLRLQRLYTGSQGALRKGKCIILNEEGDQKRQRCSTGSDGGEKLHVQGTLEDISRHSKCKHVIRVADSDIERSRAHRGLEKMLVFLKMEQR